MNTTVGTTTSGRGTISRRRVALLPALLLALRLGSHFAPGVEAKRVPANGASIATRVQAQKDLCSVGGGSFESKETAFGSTITTCTGGDGGAGTCVNTEQSTNCHDGLTRPEEDPHTPPIGGVYDEPVVGGNTGGVVGGGVVNGRNAQAQARHGKGKKGKSGKRKK